jgi:hypothetical protein
MNHITQILIDNDFKPHRKVYKNKSFNLIECEYNGQFSTESGCLDYRFIKDGFEVVYGLHEQNKPPTLISPRPVGIYTDNEMNELLMKDSLEVYNNIIKNK